MASDSPRRRAVRKILRRDHCASPDSGKLVRIGLNTPTPNGCIMRVFERRGWGEAEELPSEAAGYPFRLAKKESWNWSAAEFQKVSASPIRKQGRRVVEADEALPHPLLLKVA